MASANHDELSPYIGQLVPYSIDAAFLALSYAVSLVGAASTLELINRRTSRKGIYNQLLLLGAALTMGGVAIWCMHYIGNRATGLLNGEPALQIAYNVRVTVASFFVPILVLLVAFFVVSSTSVVSWWRIAVSGTLSGCAICGMHYLGNASISNYHCEYVTANVAGSAVIAVAASTVALALFFVFRAAWTNSWWRRIGCAVVLAGAVSGMHWCGALGTSYRLVDLDSGGDHESRNTTVIVVSCLSVGACLVMAVLAISSARARRGYASKAQRITLAAAVFDKQGKILVTPDGLLPSEEITSTFMQKTQQDVFSTAHPLFHWVFQASHNWPSVENLINKMNEHLSGLPHHGRNVRTGIHLVDHEGHIIDNYDVIFRELFCLAAACLADRLHERLSDAGILWDGMFATGGPQVDVGDEDSKGEQDLAEKGLSGSRRQGHGSLMLLVRRLENSRAVDRLEAAGFRFAELHQVAPIICSTMQIRNRQFEESLRAISNCGQGTMLDPGVHVGLFVVRSRADPGGFDVLVRRQAHNLLPSVWMPLDRLEPSHSAFLRRLDGMSVSAAVKQLRHMDSLSQQDVRFAGLLRDAIKDLRAAAEDPALDEARLVSNISQVPCGSTTDMTKPLTCSLITFTLLLPANASVNAPKLIFIPLQFFKTQQLVYENSPHHAAFARSVHREVVPVLNTSPAHRLSDTEAPKPTRNAHLTNTLWTRLGRPRTSASTRTLSHAHTPRLFPSTSRERMTSTPSNNSTSSIQLFTMAGRSNSGDIDDLKAPSQKVKEVTLDLSSRRPPPTPQRQNSFGGIMISSEVTVDVEEVDTIPTPGTNQPETSPGQLKKPQDDGDTTNTASVDGIGMGSQGGGKLPPAGIFNERETETGIVPSALGVGFGHSRVEVKKEGEATTFVDDLLAVACIDTPRRM